MSRTGCAVLALILTTALAGCSDSGVAAEEAARSRVLVDLAAVPGVDGVGIGRDGGATDLVITVLPDLDPTRAEELLDEGIRRVWESHLDPLTTIRVTVTVGQLPSEAEPAPLFRYDEDVQDVEDELSELYGPRDADAS